MIEYELHTDTGILEVRPIHRLESTDFEELTRTVDAYLEETGELKGVLIRAESFPGWSDFAALLSHFRFVRDHHQRVKRVAAVSDSSVLKVLPLVARHFVKAEVKHFDQADRAAALKWLTAEETMTA